MARNKSKSAELGFEPFIVTDKWGEYMEGADTVQEAVKLAGDRLRDQNDGPQIIYMAVRKVEAQPIDVEITGVSL